MVSQAKIDANRRNAQKSTGPRSDEGKERARLNALKHGVTAQTPVLPGEDPALFHGLVEAFTAGLQPQNPVESILIDQMALFTTQSNRALRVESARAAANVLTAPDRARQARDLEALALGQRLFFDRRGPLAGYPNGKYDPPKGIRTSWSGTPEDPDDPARLVMLLESTRAGCRWLLDRWGELRARLTEGGRWQSPEKFKAIRLLGRQPLDAADVTEVAEIFLAADRLNPQHGNPFFELRSELIKIDELDEGLWKFKCEDKAPPPPTCHNDLEDDPEEELLAERELMEERLGIAESVHQTDPLAVNIERFRTEFWQYDDRIRERNLKAIRPKNAEAARAVLLAIVDRAVDRLRPIEEANRIKEAALDALRADMAAFDDSTEGERVRRQAHACDRGIHRSIATLLKMRKASSQRSAVNEWSGQQPAISGQQEGEGGSWSVDDGYVPANRFLQNEANGRLNWDLPYEPGDVSDADLQNKPNGRSYPGLQHEANAAPPDLQNEANHLGQQLQSQPSNGSCGDLQNEPNDGVDGRPFVNQPPPPTACCLPPTAESGQQSAVSNQQEDESVPRSADCADVRANGFLQNEANAGRDGDRETEANDPGEEPQSQPSNGSCGDLQIEPNHGDDGHTFVNQPPAPTAHCLPPTAYSETNEPTADDAGHPPPNLTPPSTAYCPLPTADSEARRGPPWPDRALPPDAFRTRISLASSVGGTPDHRKNRKNRRKRGKRKGR
jgi:hypothetical protein